MISNIKKRLHHLADRLIHRDIKYRIEFMTLAIQHELVDDICHYRLWDEGYEGLGERQWDDCGEMGDADDVLRGVHANLIKSFPVVWVDTQFDKRFGSYWRDKVYAQLDMFN